MNLYYRIWTDAIIYYKLKLNGLHSRKWLDLPLFVISISMGVNLITLFFWIKVFFGSRIDPFITMEIFPSDFINNLASALLTLFFPFLITNYFLILRNDRYKKLISYYGYRYKGKLFIRYIIISFSLFIVPIVLFKLIVALNH